MYMTSSPAPAAGRPSSRGPALPLHPPRSFCLPPQRRPHPAPLPAPPAPPVSCTPATSDGETYGWTMAADGLDSKGRLKQQVTYCVASWVISLSCTQLIGLTGPTGSSLGALKGSASARQLMRYHFECTPVEHSSSPAARPGPARSGGAPAARSPHTAASTLTPRTPRAHAPCTGHQAVYVQ